MCVKYVKCQILKLVFKVLHINKFTILYIVSSFNAMTKFFCYYYSNIFINLLLMFLTDY